MHVYMLKKSYLEQKENANTRLMYFHKQVKVTGTGYRVILEIGKK